MTSFPAVLPDRPAALEQLIVRHEHQAAPLKKGAGATIVWHEEQQKNKTPYSIVYLHGFKATRREGDPLHRTIAQTFGCNLYLARLHGHGLKCEEPFKTFSTAAYIQSALDACRIGQKIGEKVLLMGTSTGGLLSLYAAGSSRCRVPIAGLLLYSPLIHLYGISSLLLEHRLSRALLRCLPGKNYVLHMPGGTHEETKVWYPSYLLNGALELGKTIQKINLPALLPNVRCPVFIGYYYKDRYEHDRVVSTSSIKRTANLLRSLTSQPCTLKNFPEAGTHVIGSSLLSNAVQNVIDETQYFLKTHIGLSSIK